MQFYDLPQILHKSWQFCNMLPSVVCWLTHSKYIFKSDWKCLRASCQWRKQCHLRSVFNFIPKLKYFQSLELRMLIFSFTAIYVNGYFLCIPLVQVQIFHFNIQFSRKKGLNISLKNTILIQMWWSRFTQSPALTFKWPTGLLSCSMRSSWGFVGSMKLL